MGLTVGSVAIEEVLLLLKIGFLVLLYLFIWRVVRAASRDLRAPQESVIIAPRRAPDAPDRPADAPGRLVVVGSPSLPEGDVRALDSATLSLGRAPENDVILGDDGYASSRHARIEPRRDGVWVADLGSTNGTYVNGIRLTVPRRLAPGDVIRVGNTDLRFER